MEYTLSLQFAQELWLTDKISRHTVIDGAEGTLRQFSLQPSKNAGRTLKVSQVRKIFITHMHRESLPKFTPSISFHLIPYP